MMTIEQDTLYSSGLFFSRWLVVVESDNVTALESAILQIENIAILQVKESYPHTLQERLEVCNIQTYTSKLEPCIYDS